MKLVNVQIIKDELERLIRDYRFYWNAETKYRYEAYKELSEWLDGLDVKDDMDTIHPIEDVVSNDPIANSYKEKYEQALMVAKETYDKQPIYREWLEKMFPELSESEDEKVRQKILFLFYAWRNNEQVNIPNKKEVEKTITWLEKQGEKVEPKSVWSEEDEKMLNDAIGAVAAADYYTYDDKQEIEDWLKSLRPQNKWKPSDEQMELLSEVQNTLLGKDCHNRFTDFMWELKKLKED